MTDATGFQNPFDIRSWIGPQAYSASRSILTGGLTQPILPGWTFGNVVVNEQNSSSPSTERDIVAAESYGRQLGKLLDAVAALIKAQGGAKNVAAFKDIVELRTKVEKIKTKAAADRHEEAPLRPTVSFEMMSAGG